MNGVHCHTSAMTTAVIGNVDTQSIVGPRSPNQPAIQLSVPLSRPVGL